ncbi:hypothetical protein QR98_0020900 [Sarcoptes scabiei]|uniref:Uncharacterized protein n=1 Tax=Sarcoptes scabiei TaxID=52283 RepID=A0A131ZXX2_SARSC|nr:hypothetical protein QR98_0020900 [Sarcoptes scabiei]
MPKISLSEPIAFIVFYVNETKTPKFDCVYIRMISIKDIRIRGKKLEQIANTIKTIIGLKLNLSNLKMI